MTTRGGRPGTASPDLLLLSLLTVSRDHVVSVFLLVKISHCGKLSGTHEKHFVADK